MEKSALQKARAAYQPKLPKALQGAVKIKEGQPTQSVGDQEEIKKLLHDKISTIAYINYPSCRTEKHGNGSLVNPRQVPCGY